MTIEIPGRSSSSRRHDIAVILVGLNAREFVRGCLQSIRDAIWRDVSYEAIYIDNASSDGSPDMVAECFPEVQLITNAENVGFCKAANQGARAADSRYYYFINDDTLVLDEALAILVEYMDGHPAAGTVGSRLLYPDHSEQWSGRQFPGLLNAALFGRRSPVSRWFPNSRFVRRYLCKDQLERGQPFEVDWVSAAGQIVRPEVFEAIGGFAEDYYYWHESVFCDWIKATGHSVILHPDSRVIHFEGKGSGPRPYPVQKFHILNFHLGAYRCYCEHNGLGRLHPARWLAGAALATRAGLLLALCRIRTLAPSRARGEG